MISIVCFFPRSSRASFNSDESRIFLGIGSVISNAHPEHSQKIVFGSGYGGYTPLPDFDGRWKFYGVRGPRTARACNLSMEQVAGNSAILINRFRTVPRNKSLRCSFIPHWESANLGNWEMACRVAGINFIDPRSPVLDVLDAIEASGMVMAEAMHGAIVADALRVPWLPILPFNRANRIKWLDWAEALDILLIRHRLWPSSTAEAWVSLCRRPWRETDASKGVLRGGLRVLDEAFVQFSALRLTYAAKCDPLLSPEPALARALRRLETNVERILVDFSGTEACRQAVHGCAAKR